MDLYVIIDYLNKDHYEVNFKIKGYINEKYER